jgi:hypothetical protein
MFVFGPTSDFHVYAVGYEVYHHPPFALIGLHSIGCKGKLINFNQFNLRVYI